MNPTLRANALKLLGLDDQENSPQRIAERVAASDRDVRTLLALLPKALVLIGPALISENYKADFDRLSSLPLKDEAIAAAREICLEHFRAIFLSEEFEEARRIVTASIQAGETRDNSAFARLPATDIGGIQMFPLLAGGRPPYIPLLRMDILNSSDTRLMSETFTWGDVLFCSMSMLGALSQHADGAADLIKDKQLQLHPEINLRRILQEIRLHADNIERRLLGEAGGTTAKAAEPPKD